MGGGLMQLVAYGAQDVYLTGNPQITFWKVTYRRHTNFAMESIEQTFNGQADFGRRVQCTVSRNGDPLPTAHTFRLHSQRSISRTPPDLALSTLVGSTTPVSSLSQWLRLRSVASASTASMVIGCTSGTSLPLPLSRRPATTRWSVRLPSLPTSRTLSSPMLPPPVVPPTSLRPSVLPAVLSLRPLFTSHFSFGSAATPALALPLIALQYHEVKVNIELRPLDECLFAVSSVNAAVSSTSNSLKVANAYAKSLVAASLYVDYVFLDTDERRRMAQNPHEYLIEQLQFTGDESIGSSSNKIKLNFNHPCKELVFVVQPDAHVAYCDSFLGGRLMHKALGAQPFNYTDAVDALPNSILAFGSANQSRGDNNVIDASGLFNDTLPFDISGGVAVDQSSGSVGPNPLTGGATTYGPSGSAVSDSSLGGALAGGISNGLTDAGVFVLAETALNMHCWGENPIVTAKLQLNGQDRFSEREGTYFDLVQPYQHHTRNPDTGINCYSFALRPEEHQPSGTCNFSRIDNATLQLVVSAAAIGGTQTAKVRVYATNYNVLRVMSGMGGLAYSN